VTRCMPDGRGRPSREQLLHCSALCVKRCIGGPARSTVAVTAQHLLIERRKRVQKREWFYCLAYLRVVGLIPIRDRWCCILDREYVRRENCSGQRHLDAATCNRRQVKV
jgi:hypothetical protein